MNNELTAALLTIEKCREQSGCPAGVDLQGWVKQLAAERDAALNAERVWEAAMMEVCGEDGPASVAAVINALTVENVSLKAGVTYFAYSPEYGFDYFKDKQSAIDTAQEEIDAYREDADDGWSEDVQRVSWGVVIQQAQGFDAQGKHTSHSQHTYQTCDYRLVDSVATPATDRIVAGIKADGVEEFAAYCGEENSVFVEAKAYYRSLPDAAYEFSSMLREGADK